MAQGMGAGLDFDDAYAEGLGRHSCLGVDDLDVSHSGAGLHGGAMEEL